MAPIFDERKNDVFRLMDVHNYSRRVAWAIGKLAGVNGETAKAFIDHLRVKGLSDARLHFYSSRLPKMVDYFDRKGLKFSEVQRRDVEEFIAWVLSKPYRAWTRQAYVLTIKKLVAYAKTGDSDVYPPEVAWIKSHSYARDSDKDSRVKPESLLSDEEILKIISHAKSLRDRAMLWVHFEAALRPGELLTMTVSSVEFKENFCIISVNGKTGLKCIPLVLSFRPLIEWLSVHPFKDEPNAPLWPSEARNRFGVRVSYNYFRLMLKRCAKEAGIKKNVWPYLLRHTQLTKLAKKLTESKLSLYAGWVQGTKVVKRYVHFSARDLEDDVLEMHGLKKAEQDKPTLQLKKCPRCGRENSPEVKRCMECGFILDPVLAAKMAFREAKKEQNIMARLEKIEKILRDFLSSSSQKSGTP
jgi:site-specific recombinase XerD/ribosomal protein L37E